MATDKTLINRIPHEDIESFSSWSLPSLGSGRVVPSVRKNKAPAASALNKEIIEDAPEVAAKQLTAEQLQSLTETAEKEAKEEGYAKGYEEGMKSGEKKGAQLGEKKAYREAQELLTEKLAMFESVADALFQPATNQDALLENSILEMAVQLTQHLLQTELTSDPSILFPIVEQAVSSLPAGVKQISVLLNPEDLPHVQEFFATKTGVWNFIADSSQIRGGCRVESDVSVLDYTIGKRIEDWKVSCRDATEAQLAEIHSPENFKPELLPDMELDQTGLQSALERQGSSSSAAGNHDAVSGADTKPVESQASEPQASEAVEPDTAPPEANSSERPPPEGIPASEGPSEQSVDKALAPETHSPTADTPNESAADDIRSPE